MTDRPLDGPKPRFRKAVRPGLAAAGIMSLLMLFLRSVGASRINLELMLGSTVVWSLGAAAWLLGLLFHLGLGCLFGGIYARAMKRLRRWGWRTGLALGFFHTILAGLLLPLFGKIHPLVWKGALTSPRIFAVDLGWREAALFGVLHLAYGLVFGALYPTGIDLETPSDTRGRETAAEESPGDASPAASGDAAIPRARG
jgi:hypothetical protein